VCLTGNGIFINDSVTLRRQQMSISEETIVGEMIVTAVYSMLHQEMKDLQEFHTDEC